MSNAKLISMIDHDIARSRRMIDQSLTRLALELSIELEKVNNVIDELRKDVDKLKQERGPSLSVESSN